MPLNPEQTGTVTLYISHGAGSGRRSSPVRTDWFIVEPRDNPERLAIEVERLRRSGRTVRSITVTPYSN